MIVNGKRALAHIEKVTNIRPIEGADNIEQCYVLGWNLICKKGEFKEGDPCVYIEIDSKVPEREEFEFLRTKGFKVKTMKLGKFNCISQGLALPQSVFKELDGLREGTDVTDILGIKYSVEEDNIRKSNGDPNAKYKSMKARHPKFFSNKFVKKLMKHEWFRKFIFVFLGKKKDAPKEFPSFISKTDEERCLIAQTKIVTDHGIKSISNIVNNQLPVKVLSMNSDGTLSYKKILDYQKFNHPSGEVLTLEYPYKVGASRLNHLCCTSDHKIFTRNGYIAAKDIKIGDVIYSPVEAYEDSCLSPIYGMLLGDSHIYRDKRVGGLLRVIATNGEEQLEYLKYKKSLFNDGKICNAGIGSFGNGKCCYHWYLPVDAYVDMNLRTDCFINGKKTITDNFLNKLTEESLAFWYMDDGCLSYRMANVHSPSIRLNTQGFSESDNHKLANLLNDKFGISCHVSPEKKNNKAYYHIYIDVDGTLNFLSLVTPYMCKSMSYKTLPQYEPLLETKKKTYKKTYRVLPCPVINIYNGQRKNKIFPQKFNTVYDIEVEDNHNFIADGVVTHNCENQPWRVGDGNTYVATEKLDGTSCTYALEKKGKNKFEFYVCSRNVRQQDEKQKCYHDHNIYWDLAFKYDIERHLRDFLHDNPELKWVCIQGEGVGSVQGNPLKLVEDDLYIFNFKDSVRGRWSSDAGKTLIEQWGMKWVPILGTVQMPDTMEKLKELATGKSAINSNVMREGLVYRSLDGKDSFKNVSREYLLKRKE